MGRCARPFVHPLGWGAVGVGPPLPLPQRPRPREGTRRDCVPLWQRRSASGAWNHRREKRQLVKSAAWRMTRPPGKPSGAQPRATHPNASSQQCQSMRTKAKRKGFPSRRSGALIISEARRPCPSETTRLGLGSPSTDRPERVARIDGGEAALAAYGGKEEGSRVQGGF